MASTKFVFVTGGVVSSLGKGLAAATDVDIIVVPTYGTSDTSAAGSGNEPYLAVGAWSIETSNYWTLVSNTLTFKVRHSGSTTTAGFRYILLRK